MFSHQNLPPTVCSFYLVIPLIRGVGSSPPMFYVCERVMDIILSLYT